MPLFHKKMTNKKKRRRRRRRRIDASSWLLMRPLSMIWFALAILSCTTILSSKNSHRRQTSTFFALAWQPSTTTTTTTTLSSRTTRLLSRQSPPQQQLFGFQRVVLFATTRTTPLPPQRDNSNNKQHDDNHHNNATTTTTTSTTTTMSQRQELDNQVQALRDAHEKNTITVLQCDAVLAQCVAADAWDTVLQVLDVMAARQWVQTHETYTAALYACHVAQNAASAYEMYQAMTAAAVKANATDTGLLVQTLCQAARFQSKWYTTALQVLEQQQQQGQSTTANSLYQDLPMQAAEAVLREMAHRHEWQRAVSLLQTLLDCKHGREKPSTTAFYWTTEACLWSNQPQVAAQILSSAVTLHQESLSKWAPPNTLQALFAAVISGLSKKQHWRKALQMLNVLEQIQQEQQQSESNQSTSSRTSNVKSTLAMYNAIMVALGKAKEYSQAKRLMRRLKVHDLRPDILTYNSLMASAARRWKDALTVLDECHLQPGVQPDVYTYTSAIRACAKGGKISRALTLLQVVQDKELPGMDAYVYTAAMEACAKGKLWQRALELLQEMQDKGIQPTKVTYSVAITACGNAGEWERSLTLLETMRSKGLAPNHITYNGAIAAIAKSAKLASKDSAQHSNHDKNNDNKQQHGSGGSSSSSSSSSSRWKHVQSLLQQMRADGLEPDGFSYSSAISCCGFEGRWKEALDLMETMRKGGPAMRPNKIAYTAAINSCGRNRQDEHALRLFTQMKEEGLEPDRVAYNALFSALRVAKRSDVALDLWQEMIGVSPSRLTRKKIATARSEDSATTPDIITVTDAIGALSADDSRQGRANVDIVLQEAVDQGVLLRNNRLDSFWEVDLSGMSLPVARAATRYILRQIAALTNDDSRVQDLTLITGVGVGKERSTTLREYVQEILQEDFDPPLESHVPKRAQGTVVVEESAISMWLSRQR